MVYEKSVFAFYVYECKLSNFFSEISVDAKMLYLRFAHLWCEAFLNIAELHITNEVTSLA